MTFYNVSKFQLRNSSWRTQGNYSSASRWNNFVIKQSVEIDATKFATNKSSAHVRGSIQQVKLPYCVERSIIIRASFTSTNGPQNGGMRWKSVSIRAQYWEVTVRKWSTKRARLLIHHVSPQPHQTNTHICYGIRTLS